LTLLAGLFVALSLLAAQAADQTPQSTSGLPSETPAQFKPTYDGFDYIRRDVMIPMRNGVKLHTVILVPRGAKGAPVLLTRTPYNANALTSHAESSPVIYEKPDALIFKGMHEGALYARVCGECGYAELFLDNPQYLYAVYKSTEDKLS
jgi:predicted acyl esterase